MAEPGTTRFYEVRCAHCETSFPPEARRCVHCGRRLGGGLLGMGSGAAAPRELADRPPALREATSSAAGPSGGEAAVRPRAFPPEEGEEELEGSRSGGLLWVATALLAVVGSALRVCQGG